MPEARCVIDTNVLISGLLIRNSVSSRAVGRLIGETQLLISDAMLTELAAVLSRKKFDAYLSQEERQTFFGQLVRIAEMVPTTTTIRSCRDPKDDKILELAVDGEADWIVTGDDDLLVLSPFRGIGIVTPAQVLDLPVLSRSA